MKIIKLILIFSLLVGCTPQKRLNRLITKHPYLAKQASVKIYDTVEVITNKVEVDTIKSLYSITKDTLIIKERNLTIKTRVFKDSIYIYGQCDTDTIYKTLERIVYYDKFDIQEIPKLKKIVGWGVTVLILIFIIFLAIKIIRVVLRI